LSENIIIIPIYNDWKSLNKLLFEINKILSSSDLYKILIINDCSTQRIDIPKKKLKKIKEIKILSLKQNLGSQKSISVGLDYLKRLNKKFYITIMDGDGEDSPKEIKQMLIEAKKNSNYVVASNRKERNENFIIKFSYKIHLIISFLLTWHWISFGNFSCFNSKNLKKLNLDDVWYAYSAAIAKNCNIKNLYASRQKRYFGNSKVNFLSLIGHSFRIMSVFYKKIFIISLLLLSVIFSFYSEFLFIFITAIIFINSIIVFIKFKNYKKSSVNLASFIKNVRNI
jgi:polyisoprenyl-phosphate glycosyltransferase